MYQTRLGCGQEPDLPPELLGSFAFRTRDRLGGWDWLGGDMLQHQCVLQDARIDDNTNANKTEVENTVSSDDENLEQHWSVGRLEGWRSGDGDLIYHETYQQLMLPWESSRLPQGTKVVSSSAGYPCTNPSGAPSQPYLAYLGRPSLT